MTQTGTVDRSDLEQQLEDHRRELTGYCYRMLASSFEAEDAVQETMIRAWRGIDTFDGRSALRTWLYRIATNVCIDMLNSRKRRAMPMDLGPSSSAEAPLAAPLPERTWIEPIADGRVMDTEADPADLVVARESVRLAFVAALQYLPPRQRSVLVLREVLRLSASEVADSLDTTVASINSALQRARATLDRDDLTSAATADPLDDDKRVLLTKYVDAFERYDIESFVSLLHDDFMQAMPPYPMWLRGHEETTKWMLGPGSGCEGSRLIPLEVNGSPGFAQYRPSGPGGRLEPWSIHVVELRRDKVAAITYFLDTNLFPRFGLPQHPDDL